VSSLQRRIAKQAATVQAQKKAMQTLANLQKKVESTLTSRKEVLAARRAALEAKQLVGYQGGEKIGKHKVLSGNVDVQLGEDLSENMREVKVSSFFVRTNIGPSSLISAVARRKPFPGSFPSFAEPDVAGTAGQTTVRNRCTSEGMDR
jgi:hypothetical protein